MGAVEQQVAGAPYLSSYGQTLARNLIDTVYMMPNVERVRELKKALDAIDPTLYGRAKRLAEQEAKAGVPAQVALQRGIALATSQGLSRELVELGRGALPGKQSQLGAISSGALAARAGVSSGVGPGQTVQIEGKAPPAGVCSVLPGDDPAKPYRVVISDGKDWRDKRDGDVCKGWQGQMSIAGFIFSPDPRIELTERARIRWYRNSGPDSSGVLPGSIRELLLNDLNNDCQDCALSSMRDVNGHKIAALRDFLPELSDRYNQDFVGGVGERENIDGRTGEHAVTDQPILTFTHPVTGEDWGMFLVLTAPKPLDHFDDKNVPYLLFELQKIRRSWIGKLWHFIKHVVAEIVHFVKDAINWVKDQGCKLLTGAAGPLIGAAAGAVGAAALDLPPQVGAQAGVVGQQLAADACGGDKKPPPASPPPKEPSKLPFLLIGGAAVAALLVLKKRKKKV
jgi:hypothetical protein